MKHTIVFTSFYLKAFMKNRKTAALLWLSPIFFLLGLGIIGSEMLEEEARVESFKVAIVNEDSTFETRLVIRQLTESPHLNRLIRTIHMDRKQAEASLRHNEIAAAVYIPKGFSRDVAKGKNTPVKVVGNRKRPLQSQLIRHVMESAADFTSAAQSGINTVYYFMEKAEFPRKERKAEFKRDILSFSLHILGRGELFEEKKQNHLFQQSLVQYYAISFYTLLIMIWSFMGLLLLKANVNRSVHTRFLSMGISGFQLAAAKICFLFLLVFISSMLLAVSMLPWQEVPIPVHKTAFIAGTMLIILVCTTFFVMIEVLIKNERLFPLISMGLLLFGAMTGGHLIPAVYFPDWLERLNAWSVNGWILTYMFSFFGEKSAYSASVLGFILFIMLAINLAVTRVILQTFRQGGIS
ncbi:ABC-2 type transport system permease protein [Bacillus fengqiuensis]|nr:ABC-2 type transport system permease protein [Bacillus fengqiuensis]